MSEDLLALSEEHRMIRDTARDFARTAIAPIAAQLDESGEFPRETIKKMGEMGFMGIEVPEEYGGAGLDSLAYVLAVEEVSRACPSLGVTMSVTNSVCGWPIDRFASEELRRRVLPGMASGQVLGGFCVTEPGSGSDAASMRATARRDGDSWVDRMPTMCWIAPEMPHAI